MIYDFYCEKCEHFFSQNLFVKDYNGIEPCPLCKSKGKVIRQYKRKGKTMGKKESNPLPPEGTPIPDPPPAPPPPKIKI